MSVIIEGSKILLSRVKIGGAGRSIDWSKPVEPVQVSPGIGVNEKPGRRHGFSVSISDDANTIFIGNLNSLDDDIEGVIWMKNGSWVSQDIVVTDQTSSPGTGYTKGLLSGDGNVFIGTNVFNNSAARIDCYTRTGNIWTRDQLLTVSGGYYRDFAIDRAGKTLVAVSRIGSTSRIHTYTRSGETWIEAGSTTIPVGTNCSVALSADGQTLVVGDKNATIGSATNTGRVIVYNRSGNSWTQAAILQHSSPVTGTYFGDRVFLTPDGNRLFAAGSIISSIPQASQVKQYVRIDGVWQGVGDFTVPGVVQSDRLAQSMAFNADGTIMAVSASNKDKGRVWVYSLKNDQWTLEQEFSYPGESKLAGFGSALAMNTDGRKLVISAPYTSDGVNDYCGTVYLYEV